MRKVLGLGVIITSFVAVNAYAETYECPKAVVSPKSSTGLNFRCAFGNEAYGCDLRWEKSTLVTFDGGRRMDLECRYDLLGSQYFLFAKLFEQDSNKTCFFGTSPNTRTECNASSPSGCKVTCQAKNSGNKKNPT